MTRDELLAELKSKGHAIVEAKDFHAMFPGRMLSPEAIEFEKHFFEELNEVECVDGKVSRLMHNPRGTSQHDVLLEFCRVNNLQFQWGTSQCAFWRGMVSPPLRKILDALGKPDGEPLKITPTPQPKDRRRSS